jgi:hypothetical protein
MGERGTIGRCRRKRTRNCYPTSASLSGLARKSRTCAIGSKPSSAYCARSRCSCAPMMPIASTVTNRSGHTPAFQKAASRNTTNRADLRRKPRICGAKLTEYYNVAPSRCYPRPATLRKASTCRCLETAPAMQVTNTCKTTRSHRPKSNGSNAKTQSFANASLRSRAPQDRRSDCWDLMRPTRDRNMIPAVHGLHGNI